MRLGVFSVSAFLCLMAPVQAEQGTNWDAIVDLDTIAGGKSSQEPDTGRVCYVSASTLIKENPEIPDPLLSRLVDQISKQGCSRGDILLVAGVDMNPLFVTARFCKFNQQIQLVEQILNQNLAFRTIVCVYAGQRSMRPFIR